MASLLSQNSSAVSGADASDAALDGDITFVDACALADVDAAAARHRGHETLVGRTSLSFYRARDGAVTCIETACPHAGPRLCDGYAADPRDIEDLLSGTGVLATCPAHSYVYDTKTGVCVASFGAGAGRCIVRDTRVDGDRVFVASEPAPAAAWDLPKAQRDAIGMRCVELALDEKFGSAG